MKAAPAVRALAKKLGVDLGMMEGSGKGGRVTAEDVRSAGEAGAPARGRPAPQVKLPPGEPENLRGPRRAMAQSMALSRNEVCPCTIFDDADIHAWGPGQDITARLLRAIVAGCRAEPALNGFYDGRVAGAKVDQRFREFGGGVYGGSVTADSFGEFIAEPSIDGALIGGAGLASFSGLDRAGR